MHHFFLCPVYGWETHSHKLQQNKTKTDKNQMGYSMNSFPHQKYLDKNGFGEDPNKDSS